MRVHGNLPDLAASLEVLDVKGKVVVLRFPGGLDPEDANAIEEWMWPLMERLGASGLILRHGAEIELEGA